MRDYAAATCLGAADFDNGGECELHEIDVPRKYIAALPSEPRARVVVAFLSGLPATEPAWRKAFAEARGAIKCRRSISLPDHAPLMVTHPLRRGPDQPRACDS
jgi:hypothetical protein